MASQHKATDIPHHHPTIKKQQVPSSATCLNFYQSFFLWKEGPLHRIPHSSQRKFCSRYFIFNSLRRAGEVLFEFLHQEPWNSHNGLSASRIATLSTRSKIFQPNCTNAVYVSKKTWQIWVMPKSLYLSNRKRRVPWATSKQVTWPGNTAWRP